MRLTTRRDATAFSEHVEGEPAQKPAAVDRRRSRDGGMAPDILRCMHRLALELWVSTDDRGAFRRVLTLVEERLRVTECGLYLQLPGHAEPCVLSDSKRLAADSLAREITRRIESGTGDDSPAFAGAGHFTSRSGVDAWLHGIPGNAVRPSYLVLFTSEPFDRDPGLESWFEQLLSQLAAVMNTLTRVFRLRRQDIYEERLAISRELHDSLAQSLTYIKIQVSRLQAVAAPGVESQWDPESLAILNELRASVNRAYRELRELMTTFRLTMHGKSFNMALEDSIKEFEQRSNLVFSLDNRLDDDCLSVDEELQVLQVIREALSNVLLHSGASQVTVRLHGEERRVVIEIDDDGVGPDRSRRKERHHGLLIMQERVYALNGKFSLEDRESGGTRVRVSFQPGQTAGIVEARRDSSFVMKEDGARLVDRAAE